MDNIDDPRVIIIDYIDKDRYVLDVGCACGELGNALNKYRNASVYGLEYDKYAIDIARKTGAYKDIINMDLDTIKSYDILKLNKKFDYIVCADVLEHLRDPMKTLNILSKLLVNNGFIILSIPNVSHASIKSCLLLDDFTYTDVGLLDETHIHFFTYKTIAKDLSVNGFKISECKFTLQDIHGRQKYDSYLLLNNDIKYFILKNWHSFVCQYVIKVAISLDCYKDLLNHNLKHLNICEENAPEHIHAYRTHILSSLGKTSQIHIAELQKCCQAKDQLLIEKEEDICKLNIRNTYLATRRTLYKRLLGGAIFLFIGVCVMLTM